MQLWSTLNNHKTHISIHITNNIEVSTTLYIGQVPRFCFIVGHIIFYHNIVVTWLLGPNAIFKDYIHQIAFHNLAMQLVA